MQMSGVPGVPRTHGLGGPELPAVREELPPLGMAPTDPFPVQGIDVKSQPGIVQRLATMRGPGQRSHPKGIPATEKTAHSPQHPPIKPHRSTGSILIATPPGRSPGRGLLNIVPGTGSVSTPAHLTAQPRDSDIISQRPGGRCSPTEKHPTPGQTQREPHRQHEQGQNQSQSFHALKHD